MRLLTARLLSHVKLLYQVQPNVAVSSCAMPFKRRFPVSKVLLLLCMPDEPRCQRATAACKRQEEFAGLTARHAPIHLSGIRRQQQAKTKGAATAAATPSQLSFIEPAIVYRTHTYPTTACDSAWRVLLSHTASVPPTRQHENDRPSVPLFVQDCGNARGRGNFSASGQHITQVLVQRARRYSSSG